MPAFSERLCAGGMGSVACGSGTTCVGGTNVACEFGGVVGCAEERPPPMPGNCCNEDKMLFLASGCCVL